MDIIPAVDVLDGHVVRLTKGEYSSATSYGDNPVDQAFAWMRRGASLVHIVDLNGARTGSPDFDLWQRLGDAGVRFQVGGGIRSPAVAAQAVSAGAERVVVGTAAVWDPDALADMLAEVGPELIVAAVDVRNGMATGAGWLDHGLPVGEVVSHLADQGVVRALVTGIERDGMMTGPDMELIARVRAAASRLSLIASGGVGSLDDVATLATSVVEAAIIGRALYEGRFTLEEALAVATPHQQA